MKKILIISQCFYPTNAPRANRTTQLACELVRQGHDVTVMIPDLDDEYYKSYTQLNGVKFKTLGNQKYKRFTGESFLTRMMARLLQLLFEFPDIQLVRMIKKTLKPEKNYDLLISIAVPHPNHWGVAKAIKNNNNLCEVWAADCGDPYMGCKTDTFNKLFHFKYVEKNWCKKCNYIVVPEESSRSGYYPEFQHKIKIIPQGFVLNEVDLKPYKKNKIPTFAYAGGLALHFRNPIPLLDYLCTLNFDFKFIIFTESEIIQPYLEKLKGKLELRKYIPREELLQILGQMDFLINFDNNTSVQTPSKLIDYALVNRPVLSIENKLNKTLIQEFLTGGYGNGMILPDIRKYDIKVVAKQFVDLI
jgi:hypothetical protein